MIAVTLYFPDEMEQAIKDFGDSVDVDVSRPVPLEFRLTQFVCGFLCAGIAMGMRRPDLAQQVKDMNYRKSERPEA